MAKDDDDVCGVSDESVLVTAWRNQRLVQVDSRHVEQCDRVMAIETRVIAGHYVIKMLALVFVVNKNV